MLDQVWDAIGPGTMSDLLGHGWIKAVSGIVYMDRVSSLVPDSMGMACDSGIWSYSSTAHLMGQYYLLTTRLTG